MSVLPDSIHVTVNCTVKIPLEDMRVIARPSGYLVNPSNTKRCLGKSVNEILMYQYTYYGSEICCSTNHCYNYIIIQILMSAQRNMPLEDVNKTVQTHQDFSNVCVTVAIRHIGMISGNVKVSIINI